MILFLLILALLFESCSTPTSVPRASAVRKSSQALPGILSLKCSPSMPATGGSGTCTITLTKPAPKGGMAFKITDTVPSVSVPMIVTVPKGATTVTFKITT